MNTLMISELPVSVFLQPVHGMCVACVTEVYSAIHSNGLPFFATDLRPAHLGAAQITNMSKCPEYCKVTRCSGIRLRRCLQVWQPEQTLTPASNSRWPNIKDRWIYRWRNWNPVNLERLDFCSCWQPLLCVTRHSHWQLHLSWVKDKDALHPAGWGCHLTDALVWGLEADLVQKSPALTLTTNNKVIPINEDGSYLFSYHSLASLEFCRLNKSPGSIFSCPQSSFWSGREGAFRLCRHGNSGRTVRFLTKPLQ